MEIELTIIMDIPTAKKFSNLMKSVRADFELADQEEIDIVNGLIEEVDSKLPK